MKTLNVTIGILLSAALANADIEKPVAELGGDGTRGGGEVIYIDGIERLRDLVDPSICDNKTGEDLRKENPRIDQILSKLAQLDWYFAAGLRWEINHLQLCFTKRLIRLRSKDWDSVIVYEPKHKDQVAIRFLNSWEVYVNRELFRELPELDQAFLPIHEAMHAFISTYAPQRNESVRNVVHTIAEVADGNLKSEKKFHKIMNKFSVEYPWVSVQLAKYRPAIEFALSDTSDQKSMIMDETDLNSLFTFHWDEVGPYLYPAHARDLMIGGANRVSALLEEEGSDFSVLNRVINTPTDLPKLTVFDPVLVALSVPSIYQNSIALDQVLSSRSMKDGFHIYSRMKDKSFELSHMRIVGNDAYSMLGVASDDARPDETGMIPALSILPYTWDRRGEMPAEVQGLINFIVTELKRGETGWKILDAAVFKNDGFYSAFEIKTVQNQLQTIQSPIAREKIYLEAAVPEMVVGLRNVLSQSISQFVGPQFAQKVDEAIDWARLGNSETK